MDFQHYTMRLEPRGPHRVDLAAAPARNMSYIIGLLRRDATESEEATRRTPHVDVTGSQAHHG